jgi:hypothetical protein
MQCLVSFCEGDDPSVHDSACMAMRLALASCCSSSGLGLGLGVSQLKPMRDAVGAAEKLLEYR